MKKYIVILAVVMLLLATTTAFAQTEKESEIVQLVKQNSNVTKAVCLVEQRLCVVAIQANKFVSRTEYQQFVDQTTQQIQQQFGIDKVIITRSAKLFYQINKIASLSEDERQELVEKLLDELAKIPAPLPYFPELKNVFDK